MTLNPLFAVEVRGRFRRFLALLQLAGAIAGGALLLYFLLGDMAGRGELSVAQARAQGAAILGAYRLWGGLLYACIGVLTGAMSLIHEKDAGTFEQLLLCPLGAAGIVRGKIASALAFSLVLQLALLPLLAVMGLICLLTPGQILWVVALHLGLCAQGVTLGLFGAIRARTIAEAVAGAVAWWIGCSQLLFFAFIVVATLLFVLYGILNFLISALAFGLVVPGGTSLHLGWLWLVGHVLLPLGLGAGTIVASVTGVPALLETRALTPLVLPGQILGALCVARWSAWQLHSPNRNLTAQQAASAGPKAPAPGASPPRPITALRGAGILKFWEASAPMSIYALVWKWELTPAQIARFPLADAAPTLASQAPTRRAAPPDAKTNAASGRRIRLVKARWFATFNPVLWLDLQRCLSLRAPGPGAQLPLLLFACLGGSLALAAGVAALISLLAGGAGDAKLGEMLSAVHAALCYGALASGPLWGAMGYVIERRSMMLHELRLTLLSARGLWWGKFGARLLIPVVASLPGLLLFQFFSGNMAESPPLATLSEWGLLISIAAASISVCLWLSFHAPHQLAAALWTLSFAIVWGGALWPFGAQLWPPLGALSPLATPSIAACALLHAGLAVLTSGSIFWKLRRMGFG